MAPNMDLCCQLSKLSKHIIHYTKFHKEEANVVGFLKEHLGKTDHKNHHKEHQDEKCPTQECGPCCQGMPFYLPALVISYHIPEKLPVENIIFYRTFFSSVFPSPLFEPPQV